MGGDLSRVAAVHDRATARHRRPPRPRRHPDTGEQPDRQAGHPRRRGDDAADAGTRRVRGRRHRPGARPGGEAGQLSLTGCCKPPGDRGRHAANPGRGPRGSSGRVPTVGTQAAEPVGPGEGTAVAGDPLFANAGELGSAMAARDWNDSPVGVPASWPSTLRNAVRILLTSRFSMWAAWGPDLTFFYNDAYRQDTLQAKHPWALGRPAREVWAEIWDDISPRIQSVLDTGVATWDEDLLLFLERSGYREETYHTFSYSPLGGDDGRTEGMLCVVTENTQRVVGERRMAHLRDLAGAVAATRTEADMLAAVADLLGRNLADLPFSVTYLFDGSGTARLGCAAGIEPGAAAAPIELTDDHAELWPLDRIRAGEQVLVDDLAARFPDLPTGAWNTPPTQAVAVPVTSSAHG